MRRFENVGHVKLGLGGFHFQIDRNPKTVQVVPIIGLCGLMQLLAVADVVGLGMLSPIGGLVACALVPKVHYRRRQKMPRHLTDGALKP